MDAHLGFNLKAGGEHREGFHELVAESPVSGHDVLDVTVKEAVDGSAHQGIPKVVEGAFILLEVRRGETISHNHVRPCVLEHALYHLRGGGGGVGVVPVQHQVAPGVYLPEHAADNVPLSLPAFPAHHGAGGPGQIPGAVGGVVVVDIDNGLRQGGGNVPDDFFDCPALVIAGNQNSDLIHKQPSILCVN